MVFAVNPGPDGSSNSFAAFLEEALEIGAELAANTTTTTSSSNTATIASSSAASPTTTASSWAAPPVTHQINVSNNTAGLIFDPSYIVRQPIIISDRCADSSSLSDCRGGRHRRVHLPSQEPQCDPVQLCRTMHALAWRIRYRLVRH
jgi:hypothetical protein